tara:strand:+ start:7054 stop:8304 length:1251 start_codon:yes stop_codon:yes gene_type:complete
MHHIDRQYWNHNSLGPGDVNGDGFDDYVVIHEGPDVVSIVFHPGDPEAVYSEWKKVIIANGSNVEYADFGDYDSDGNLDVAYANGEETGEISNLSIIWGPDKGRVMDPEAWKGGGPLPESIDQGQYLFLESFDVNADGGMDIVAGGRMRTEGGYTGLIWFEAPAEIKDRRNLNKWKRYSIDPDLESGHGFVFVDIDADGDSDIAVGNADWDTTETEEGVFWYENPGPSSGKIGQPWKKRVIMRSKQFFAKNQLGVGDLNNDGKVDLVAQSDNIVFYLQQIDPNNWKTHKIIKPEITRWVTRPIKLVDIDHDGKLDIVGMTIHNYGYTPLGKASVFWMQYEGDEPGVDNWITRVIKWSDGFFSPQAWNGEKWDHMRFVDVDRDGDLDIVGNCEEYYIRDNNNRRTQVGVVWFENPIL